MFKKVQAKANAMMQNGDILLVVGNKEWLVNAIQRFSDVIIQKSTREGFCLAVTEAMWKGTPVVASNVGGIPSQIEDGRSGYLLEATDLAGFADRIVHLLKNPDEGRELGRVAMETVREKFLITRLLADYLDMLSSIMQ
jgi:trehalose synthase